MPKVTVSRQFGMPTVLTNVSEADARKLEELPFKSGSHTIAGRTWNADAITLVKVDPK